MWEVQPISLPVATARSFEDGHFAVRADSKPRGQRRNRRLSAAFGHPARPESADRAIGTRAPHPRYRRRFYANGMAAEANPCQCLQRLSAPLPEAVAPSMGISYRALPVESSRRSSGNSRCRWIPFPRPESRVLYRHLLCIATSGALAIGLAPPARGKR
jgi:hypothetical protein